MSEDFQLMVEHLDMESYFDAEGIEYRKTAGTRGIQLNVKECPKCGGDSWKVYINADTGLGNCFHGSCEEKFNKVKFIRAGLGDARWGDVIKHIEAHVASSGWRPKRESRVVDLRSPLVLPDSIAIPIKGTSNLKYLALRNIDIETAKYFHLRYSESGKFVYKDAYENERVMSFAQRIIIPVFNLSGTLVSFQGRDITGQAEKKYLFPPGYAATGAFLFNGHNVVNADTIVINEGVFDVFATKIALDSTVETRDVVPVGTFGKHLSVGEAGKDQLSQFIALKSRGVKRAVIMWDSEPAALIDACNAAEVLTSIGLNVQIAILPFGKDPNEVSSSEVLKAYYQARNYSRALKLELLHKLKLKA